MDMIEFDTLQSNDSFQSVRLLEETWAVLHTSNSFLNEWPGKGGSKCGTYFSC